MLQLGFVSEANIKVHAQAWRMVMIWQHSQFSPFVTFLIFGNIGSLLLNTASKFRFFPLKFLEKINLFKLFLFLELPQKGAGFSPAHFRRDV